MGTLHTQPASQNYLHVPQKDSSNLVFLLTRIIQLYKSRESKVNNYRLIPIYLSTVIA